MLGPQPAGSQLLFGPGEERRGPQPREQRVRLAQTPGRVLAVTRAAQEPAVGQQQPGGVDRAFGTGGVLAALVGPQRLLRRAAQLGQPPLQPGQGRGQVLPGAENSDEGGVDGADVGVR